jgi:hypothetical protein
MAVEAAEVTTVVAVEVAATTAAAVAVEAATTVVEAPDMAAIKRDSAS